MLIGAAGAGKSTLARRLFDPADVLSSDDLREAVAGDPADQRATQLAFSILHRGVRQRLAAGRLVVVDATNVTPYARASLLRIAAVPRVPALAIVLWTAAPVVHRRNAGRPERVVPPDVVDRHLAAMARLGADPAEAVERLRAEGFADVRVVVEDELVGP